jgi:hypothetical protein
MVALTQAAPRRSRKLGVKHTIPVAAGVRIFPGAAVMVANTGVGHPAAPLANNRGCWGCALHEADNRLGADGDIDVVVQEGEYLFAADTLEINDAGVRVFCDDDNTIDETQAANAPQAGLLTEFVSATAGWVAMSQTNAVV